MKKKKLRRWIQDLEIETEFRTSAILALAHAVRPPEGFRYHYLMYAIHERFTAAELERMETFWRDVCRQNELDAAKGLSTMTREWVIDEFNERIPTRAGTLEQILQADRLDGTNGVFHLLSSIVLDLNPRFHDKQGDELERPNVAELTS